MHAAQRPTGNKAMTRSIVTSFTAGIGAMVAVGLLTAVVSNGGLSMPNAEASTFEQRGPLIRPLDVAAIEAQLSGASDLVDAAKAASEADRIRLERIAGR